MGIFLGIAVAVGYMPFGALTGVIVGHIYIKYELRKLHSRGADESEIAAFLAEQRANWGATIFQFVLMWPIAIIMYPMMGIGWCFNRIFMPKALRQGEGVNR